MRRIPLGHSTHNEIKQKVPNGPLSKGMDKAIEKGIEKRIDKGIDKGIEKGIEKGNGPKSDLPKNVPLAPSNQGLGATKLGHKKFAETNNQGAPKQISKNLKETIAPRRELKTKGHDHLTDKLEACRSCGRTFNEKALLKHEKICQKVFMHRRKPFNSAKQRIVAREQINLKKMGSHVSQKETGGGQIPLWKQQSLAFRLAMKSIKGGPKSGEEIEFEEMSKKGEISGQPGLIKCKVCHRSFNSTAAARHIPICEKKAKDVALKHPVNDPATKGRRR